MKWISLAVLVLCSVSARADTSFLPVGPWESRSYGFLWDVGPERIQGYDISPVGCVKNMGLSHADAIATLGKAVLTGPTTASLTRSNAVELLTKLPALPDNCRKPLYGASADLNLEVFLSAFDVHYPFFADRKVDWPALKSDARARVKAGEDLFAVLTGVVEKIGDGHVSISDGKRSVSPDSVVAPGVGPDGKAWTWRNLRSAFRNELQSKNGPLKEPAVLAGNNRILFGETRDGYGYVAIMAMGGWAEGQDEGVPSEFHAETAGAVFQDVLDKLKDAPGLILDVRVNSGGFDAVSMRLAQRFANATRDVFMKTSQGLDGVGKPYAISISPGGSAPDPRPVAVLFGPNSVSAAETFAIAMKGAPKVATFGQLTRGSWSDAIPKALPNGWTFTLSMEIATELSGRRLEGAGVTPDFPVTNKAPVSSVYWNAEIDAARTWLNAQSKGKAK